MRESHPFDLYAVLHQITQDVDWIEEVYIFGSRRYLSNSSFGSDIDLVFIPNRDVSTSALRQVCTDPYIDPFLLDNTVAISAANETRVPVDRSASNLGLDAKLLWTREGGWKAEQNYRLLQIIPNRTPIPTVSGFGAEPVVLFCALSKEFDAVVRRLPSGKYKTHSSLPTHFITHLPSKSGRNRLVIVTLTGVASVQAGISTARILEYFDGAKIGILIGITAGLKERGTALGDILLPKASIDVEAGKVTPKGKEPAGLSIQTDSSLHSAIACWPGRDAWATKWSTKLSGKETTPTIHDDCTLACTASVIAYDQQAQSYRDLNRKIAGIEMEAVGVGTAIQTRCPFLIVKSISDWADSEKDDRWHSYCAEAVADLVVSALSEDVI